MTADDMEFSDTPEVINPEIGMIAHAKDTVTKPAFFRSVIEDIRLGRWSAKVKKVRDAYAIGGKDGAGAPKRDLPGALFSGIFTHRANEGLIKHSGLICADLDELGDQLENYRELIVSDPHTLACFVSPTGTGLKVVFRCDPAKPHIESFHATAHHVMASFGLEIDKACKEVARVCFVSHDPDAFVSETATPLEYLPPPKEHSTPLDRPRTGTTDLSPGDDYDSRGDLSGLLLAHGWTKRGKNNWTRPDKSDGISATFDKVPGRFYVFTSSTQFEPNHVYRPWHVYALLECGGDYTRAAKELAGKGFGSPAKTPDRRQLPGERMLAERSASQDEPKPADYESRRVKLQSPPKEPTTRLFLAGKPIATPGNLVTIISRAKTGKTATLGAAVAAIIAAHHDRHDMDTLKFSAPHTDEAVILIDTEQSPYDAWTCHSRAMARAGQDSDPSWLMHYAMVGCGSTELRTALPKIIAKAKAEHKGIFTIILDGVADFVASVNDEAECNDFITWLRALAVDHDCPILCVIHSNEGIKNGDDGRGHLGKQLTRKAESNLLLKKTGEITTVTSEKQRKAPITEADGVAFKWDEALQRHVTCAAESVSSGKMGGRPKQFTFEKFISIFPRSEDKAMTKQALLRYAVDIAPIKETSFRDILNEAVSRGELERRQRHPQGFVYFLSLPGKG